jgi:hypothetical protein
VIRSFVSEGEMYPRGYGFAWMEPCRYGAVCYPVPLNIAARGVRIAWHWLRFGYRGQRLMRREQQEQIAEDLFRARSSERDLIRRLSEDQNEIRNALLIIRAQEIELEDLRGKLEARPS